MDLFPSEPPESPAVRTKKSKSSSKKKGSSSKHTYAKEIENTRSQRPNTRSQRAQNEPQAVETSEAELPNHVEVEEVVGRVKDVDLHKKEEVKRRKVIFEKK